MNMTNVTFLSKTVLPSISLPALSVTVFVGFGLSGVSIDGIFETTL